MHKNVKIMYVECVKCIQCNAMQCINKRKSLIINVSSEILAKIKRIRDQLVGSKEVNLLIAPFIFSMEMTMKFF